MTQRTSRVRLALLCAAPLIALAGCAAQHDRMLPAAPPPPQGDITQPGKCAANDHPDDFLIGKTEAEASALLDGCVWRLGERDAQQFPGTMDYRADRRTIGVKAGKVAWVRRG